MALRVVIVDDHTGFRAEARALLEDEGYVVAGEAADGAAAISIVRETAPDIVLLDIQLPDISGFQVAERLERESPYARVILISSRDAADYRERLAIATAPFISKGDLSVSSLEAALAGLEKSRD